MSDAHEELRRKVLALLESSLPKGVLVEVVIDVVARGLGRLGGRPRNGSSAPLTHVEGDVPKPVTKPGDGGITGGSGSLFPESDPEPSQSDPERSNGDGAEPAGFLEFWGLYPKKVGKTEARRAFKRRKPPMPKVRATLAWQKTSRQWREGIIPNPATWLNQGRWEDEPPKALPAPRTGPAGLPEWQDPIKRPTQDWPAKEPRRLDVRVAGDGGELERVEPDPGKEAAG